MSLWNSDDENKESEEDRLFKDAGSFEMPLSEMECQELENHAFKPDVIEHMNKFMPANADSPMNKMALDVLYMTSKNADAFKKLITGPEKMGLSNPFAPAKLDKKAINMSAFLLFGMWKRGLFIGKEVYETVENFYKEHREFHKKIGNKSFMDFLSLCSAGYILADKFYNNNLQKIVEDQISFFEKEMNAGNSIT